MSKQKWALTRRDGEVGGFVLAVVIIIMMAAVAVIILVILAVIMIMMIGCWFVVLSLTRGRRRQV